MAPTADSGDAPRQTPTSPMAIPAANVNGNNMDDDAHPLNPAAATAPAREQLQLTSADMGGDFVPTPQQQERLSSWSTSSDKQLFTSPRASNDRVFPIRSVVAIDPTQTPYTFQGRTSGEHADYFPNITAQNALNALDGSNAAVARQPSADGLARPRRQLSEAQANREAVRRGRRQSSVGDGNNHHTGLMLFNSSNIDGSDRSSSVAENVSAKISATSNSIKSGSAGGKAPSAQGSIENRDGDALITARFKHVVTAEGHAIITGRDGDTLQRCEDEPIHIPGAVQGFGLLIALVEDDQGHLVVRVVSENSVRIIGYSPRELFALESLTDILSEEQQENLLDHVDFIRDEGADPASTGPEVFTITFRPPKSQRRGKKLWCAMHVPPSQPDIIICEFEMDDDQLYPYVPANERTPETPEDTLDSHPTAEEFQDSTQNLSKPLRILRTARRRQGEAAAMEVFNIMSQVQEQLASATSLDQFLRVLVGVVKELTGFHRVMIYQFDSSFNGRVVTELVDPRATKDLYKGLNFPASDIPKQARDLYRVNKVRMLYDRDLETARLVCRTMEDLEEPLDLTYSYLRAMSPIHIKYLANMAVRSSMSISITAFRELWGLIACHSYGPRGMRVPFPIRKMCRLVGDVASRNIERLSYASRLQARKLINTVPTAANPSGYIIASSDDLLRLFDADFGMLSIRGETKILGKMQQTQEALAMLEYLRLRKIVSVATSQDIAEDFPDLRYAPGFEEIAGLLLVPLSVGGNDFIVFFRKGQVKEVKWAGNPYEKFIKEGTEGYLEPRKSFKVWSETVVGKCRDWTEEQVETAAVLCLVYGKFIEVWRQKEAALQNSQLTRLLLANSAHEVRTPLNAIINYLEIALEGALDSETRENLAKSHSASKSLIYVINDLLDLTKTEEGQNLIKEEVFDLPATVREATDQFQGDARRKGLAYEIHEHAGVPQFVQGDQRRVRQAVANITANAIQHTNVGSVTVEFWMTALQDDNCTVEVSVQDTGVGMSNEKLDAIFRDLEQVSTDDAPGILMSATTDTSAVQDRSALGLGLAMVARIIRNMDGQLRLKSTEGEGTRFIISLSFPLPAEHVKLPGPSDSARLASGSTSARTPPAADASEVLLVRKGSSLNSKQPPPARKQSAEEMGSLRSMRSDTSTLSKGSGHSDVDRLISALSGPLSNDEDDDHRSLGKQSIDSRKSIGSIGSLPSSQDQSMDKMQSDGVMTATKLGGGMPRGYENVQDSKTPLRPVRMPEETPQHESQSPLSASKLAFYPQRLVQPPHVLDVKNLQVLVAEDDPVNSRIIKKRLEKSGHSVRHTANGEECSTVYCEQPAFFDVVLMDMQMPIVDGLTATKMIRSSEKSQIPATKLSRRAAGNGRVPIFAVSASLVERERETYINAGFDGWILKPIDFKRVNVLLEGIVNDDTRRSCLYAHVAEWEHGGWFCEKQQSPLQADTKPSEEYGAVGSDVPGAGAGAGAGAKNLQLDSAKKGSISSSSAGSTTPTNDSGSGSGRRATSSNLAESLDDTDASTEGS